jgi:LacI family repressor for deo operon, udp, cdd, tsx, nupC, and nupG
MPEPATAADQRQPTMADVARVAEVSTATVSYYLSGRSELRKRIGPDAQLRIKDAVRALGYVQNKVARQLRLQRTERICVLLPKLGIPFADKMAQDIDTAARRRGYSSIVVAGQSFDDWQRVLRDVDAGLADGIFADADPFTEAELTELFGSIGRVGKPSLILHATAAPTLFSVMNHGRTEALRLALDHLRSTGRRHFAYVENQTPRANPRAALVRDYAAAHPGEMELVALVEGASSRAAAADATRALMALERPPTAILVESDFTAVTVIEELQRLGRTVPDDVAVIGCGNAEEGYYCNPRLTTIGPTSMSLTIAADHLIDLIENRADVQQRRFVVPWTFYRRESA